MQRHFPEAQWVGFVLVVPLLDGVEADLGELHQERQASVFIVDLGDFLSDQRMYLVSCDVLTVLELLEAFLQLAKPSC